ncbi:MAG: polysaccharide biosynthesis C-terminal domain-containing protein [Lachnospiraceae bacterium]|nr:polysaccharide biosynthesis C-terminal domain-containing protein [Lachnospiraceae bacterium]
MGKREKKTVYLFKNMALFSISSFVSKLLVFLLVPFYTSVLTESEYGIADVMQSSLLLLVPMLTVTAGEAALRYGLEYTEDRDEILYHGFRRAIISIAPVALIAVLLSFLFPENRIFFLLFIVLYTANVFYEYMLLYCQGTEEVKKMIIGSVSCTLFIITSNLIFLLIFRLGIYGYLFAQITAFSGSALIMFLLNEGPERLKRRSDNRELRREMDGYGGSLIMYSTASWINNAIDRYFILFMLGSSQNGLYGAAYKIPAILATIQRIFAMAWQMSAVKEYKGEDRDEFFSGMYRLYQAILVLGCSGIILFLKPIAAFMFRKGFFEAWVLVPPLLISIIFGAMEGFLGSIALAFKDGKSMGIATGTGAFFNIVLNYFLIAAFGSFGAAVATFCSYFIMFVLAFIFVRRHTRLQVSLYRDMAAYGLLAAESVMVIRDVRYFYLWNTGIVLLLIFMYHREIRRVVAEALEMVQKRFGHAGQSKG